MSDFYASVMPHIAYQRSQSLSALVASFDKVMVKADDDTDICLNYDMSSSEIQKDTGILFIHGIGSNRKVFAVCADIARKAGYNVAFFDLRGHGDSGQIDIAVKGEYSSCISSMLKDIKEILTYLRSMDASEIMAQWLIIGHSYGANLAFELSQDDELSSHLRGIVCVDGGFISLRDVYATWNECVHSSLIPPSTFFEGICYQELLRIIRDSWL